MRRKETFNARTAARAIVSITAKRVSRQGLMWGYVFGATVAASAYSFHSVFSTPASRATLASMQANVAWSALFGPLIRLDTVAGYTAYKSGMTVMILGAIWGLLIATKVTRGEEDAGRWELLLSGHTDRAGATSQAAIGLGAGWLAAWIPTALLIGAVGLTSHVGFHVGASLYAATALLAPTLMFMAVGLLAGQLSATRHDADLIGAGVLAGSYLVRMAADSDPGLVWLRWVSPLGWVEQLRPLTGSTAAAFVPILALAAALVVSAILVARDRDLGASAFASHDSARARTLLLGDQAGLTVRLTLPVVVSWIAALSVCGLVFGLVAQAAGQALKGAAGIERAIQRLGGNGAGAATYLGLVFVIAAGLVAIAVAGQVSALRNEEASGRLDNLLVRPVARWRWLAVRLGVGLVLVIASGVFAGVAAWVGAASQHADVGLGKLIEAGLNVAPPAVFTLGIGGLAFGLWPRRAIAVVYGLVVWSFLVETLASVFNSNHWLRDTSPMLHMAPAPAAAPDWTAAAWLVGLGVAAAAAGVGAFARRDVASE